MPNLTEGTLKNGEIVGVYKIIQLNSRTDKEEKFDVKCIICNNISVKYKHQIMDSQKYPTKDHLCPHISITKSGGYNDLIGFTKQSEENYRIYSLWNSMLSRTSEYWYSIYAPTYADVKIDPNWKYLSKFAEEIKQVEGYKNWLNNPGQYVLDKDIKSPINNRIYSKDTCCFITWKESKDDIDNRHPELTSQFIKTTSRTNQIKRGKKIKAFNPETKEQLFFISQSSLARYFNSALSAIEKCLKTKKVPHYHKGWYLEEISTKDYFDFQKKYPQSCFVDEINI